jgi:hypothetical protein
METAGRKAEAAGGKAEAADIGSALALYFIVLPRFYGFSTLGQPLPSFALVSLFAAGGLTIAVVLIGKCHRAAIGPPRHSGPSRDQAAVADQRVAHP